MTKNNNAMLRIGQFLADARPSSIDPWNTPSIDHCLGTGRLLGERYAQAIAEAVNVRDVDFQCLDELCLLMRSFIVLDDHRLDSMLAIGVSANLEVWLKTISDACRERIIRLQGDPQLWEKYLSEYRSSSSCESHASPYVTVQHKCAFLFLPFDLFPDTNVRRVHQMVSDYLFALQLADDFADIEEDIRVPHNRNLFISGIDEKGAWRACKMRGHFAEPLLNYMLVNLEPLAAIAKQNGWRIFHQHVSHATTRIHHLMHQDHAIELPLLVEGKNQAFQYFRFEKADLDRMSQNIHAAKFNVNCISAPFFHSLA